MLVMNILIRIDDLVPKLQIWAKLVLKLKCVPIFILLGIQNKSNMLIMTMLIGIDDLDQKFHLFEFNPNTEMCFDFCETWYSEQIKHANYEYAH